jgi:hypothetical protein
MRKGVIILTERIRTLHPAGKQGVNIERAKYDQVKAAIIAALEKRGEGTFTELSTDVEQALQGNFEGSIPWYCVSVKLDLEARGIIERLPKTQPHRVRLTPIK